MADKFGRSKALFVNDAMYLLGILVSVFAPNLALLIIGRFVTGLGVGSGSILVPLLLNEISPDEIRGSLGVLNQLFVTIGILFAYLMNSAFAGLSNSISWRLMFAVAFVPCVIHIVGALIVKIERPKWLYLKGNLEGATRMLRKLRGNTDVREELDNLASEEDHNNTAGKTSRLCIRKNFKGLLIGVGLNFFQQAVGINAIL